MAEGQGAPRMYESHMHTELCKHSKGTPDEYARVALERGLKGMTVTCHCPLPDGINAESRMAPDQVRDYADLVSGARERFRGRLDVRLGLESDYLPQFEPWLRRLHAEWDFSYILGSVHPLAGYYLDEFWHDSPLDFQRTYYRHLAEAAESGLFDCLSHPDLVKNKNYAPEEWSFEAVREDIGRALDRIARTGVSMELNTSGLLKRIKEFNPGREQLAMMRERGITVVIGADAHVPSRVGDRFPEALDLLQDVGYTSVSFYLDRQRHDLDIDRARQSLQTQALAA